MDVNLPKSLEGAMAMDYVKQSTLFPIERAFRIVVGRAEILLQRTIGCSRREVWVLLCVDDTQLSQRQIGEQIGLHPNVLVKLLDGMEERELIRRVRRLSDRREQIVEATGEGKRRLKTYLVNRPDTLLQIFHPLTTEQIEQWRDLAVLILMGTPNSPISEGDS